MTNKQDFKGVEFDTFCKDRQEALDAAKERN